VRATYDIDPFMSTPPGYDNGASLYMLSGGTGDQGHQGALRGDRGDLASSSKGMGRSGYVGSMTRECVVVRAINALQ